MALGFVQFRNGFVNWPQCLPASVIVYVPAYGQIWALNTMLVHHSPLSSIAILCTSQVCVGKIILSLYINAILSLFYFLLIILSYFSVNCVQFTWTLGLFQKPIAPKDMVCMRQPRLSSPPTPRTALVSVWFGPIHVPVACQMSFWFGTPMPKALPI